MGINIAVAVIMLALTIMGGIMSAKRKWQVLSVLFMGGLGIVLVCYQIYSQSHQDRCASLLNKLHKEWILSQNGITPQMLAGTESPPLEWLNKRSRELGSNCQYE